MSLRIKRIIDELFDGNKSEFARIAGISESAVRSYLMNTIPKADVLEKIANSVAISCEWLVTGRGEPFTPAAGEEKEKSGEKGGISSGGGIIADKLFAIIQEKDGVIRQQAEEIGRLRERVLQLERGKGRTASDAQTSGIADAG